MRRFGEAIRDWFLVAWPGLLKIAGVIVLAFVVGLVIKAIRGG